MRIALIIFVSLLLSCNTKVIENTVVKTDTIFVKMPCDFDSTILYLQSDSIKSLSSKYDSIYNDLRVSNAKLYRIKYYTDICNRKPSQDKFLRGWINRVIK